MCTSFADESPIYSLPLISQSKEYQPNFPTPFPPRLHHVLNRLTKDTHLPPPSKTLQSQLKSSSQPQKAAPPPPTILHPNTHLYLHQNRHCFPNIPPRSLNTTIPIQKCPKEALYKSLLYSNKHTCRIATAKPSGWGNVVSCAAMGVWSIVELLVR